MFARGILDCEQSHQWDECKNSEHKFIEHVWYLSGEQQKLSAGQHNLKFSWTSLTKGVKPSVHMSKSLFDGSKVKYNIY